MSKLFIMYDDEGNKLYSNRHTACITEEGHIFVFDPSAYGSEKQDHVKPENVVFNNGMTLHDAMLKGLFAKPCFFWEKEKDGMKHEDDVRLRVTTADQNKTLIQIDFSYDEAIGLRNNLNFIISEIDRETNRKKGWFKSWVAMLLKMRVG